MGPFDGCHINIKVPIDEHYSYADRYLSHSINLIGIYKSKKIFIYVFIGFPGSAHDAIIRIILH